MFTEKRIKFFHRTKDEVRIKIKATGFNPVDFKIRQGLGNGSYAEYLSIHQQFVVKKPQNISF